MRALSTSLPGQFRRSPLALSAFLVFLVFAAYVVSQFVLSGDTANLVYVALAFGGVAMVITMLNDWRRGLYLFLAWLLFEDFARKYLGNNMAIYFGKDIFVAIIYISFFVSRRRKQALSFTPPFNIAVLLFVWFGVLQIFNPGSASIFYGLLGLKLYFIYIPLLYVGYALIESEADLRRFFFVNLMFALIINGLGIAQAILGHTFLNPSHIADDIRELSTNYRVAPISGAIAYRPTSVFVSGGRFIDYVLVTWILVLGFAGYLLLRSRSGRTFTFLVLGVTAAAAVLTTSRGVFLWSTSSGLVILAAFLWGAPWRQGEAIRAVRAVQRALLFVGLALILLIFFSPDALDSRLAVYSETLSPNSPASELMYRARDYPLRNFMMAFDYDRWPYGYGIGTASLGGQYVTRILKVPPMRVGVENGYGALIVELGIVGLALFLVMSAAICLSAWKVVRKLKGSPWFPLAFVIFWYAFFLLVPLTYNGFQPYQDFVMNAYLWLTLGILFRLPTIALSEQFAVAAATAKPRRRWIV